MMQLIQTGKILIVAIGIHLAAAQCSVSQNIEISAFPSQNHVQPSEIFQVAITLKIEQGWHVYSPLEAPDGGNPLTIAPVVHSNVLFGDIRYPAGEKHSYEFAGEQWEYRNEIVIPVVCKLNENFTGDEVDLQFVLNWQICSESVCLPPVKFKPIKLSIPVKKNIPSEPVNKEFFGPKPDPPSWIIVSQDGIRPGGKVRVLFRPTRKKSESGKLILGDGTDEAGSVVLSSLRSDMHTVQVGRQVDAKFWTIKRRPADGSQNAVAVALPVRDAATPVRPIYSAEFDGSTTQKNGKSGK